MKKAMILLSLILSLSANAAPKPKTVVHEKYAATEEDGTAKTINAAKPIDGDSEDLMLDAEIPVRKVKKAEVKVEAPVVAKAEPAPVADTEEKFDTVPKEKIEEIAERVKYAYEILKKHGRAYDYRSTTLRELKTTLANLDSSEKN